MLDKANIGYVYPGDSSFMATANQESDEWQIVMPIKNGTIDNIKSKDNTETAADIEDNIGIVTFIGACGGVLSDELISNKENYSSKTKENLQWQANLIITSCVTTCISTPQVKATLSGSEQQDLLPQLPKIQSPPVSPPGYSVPIHRFSTVSNPTLMVKPRKVDDYYLSCSPTSTMDISPNIIEALCLDSNEPNDRGGILPTARARLASLKSLGTRKFNALKSRLSDTRHKEFVDCKMCLFSRNCEFQ